MGGQSFNFIFRSCKTCNGRKADAERHVSSVTLFNSPGRRENEQVNAIAIRKGESDFHPLKKGVKIENAHEHISMNMSFGATSMNLKMSAPPQLDRNRVREVAFSHIQGLFALICSEDHRVPEKMRLLPLKHFIWFDCYTHDDWGNSQIAEVANRAREWDCLANINSAQGYFKAIMRRGEQGWFWALEWNRQLRLIGGIGEPGMKLFEGLPEQKWISTPHQRIRKNTPLDGMDDELFTGSVLS